MKRKIKKKEKLRKREILREKRRVEKYMKTIKNSSNSVPAGNGSVRKSDYQRKSKVTTRVEPSSRLSVVKENWLFCSESTEL
ncbi:hypothetical protein [Domibacillus indicus]|uniref:hypothetical protein n=1 Tax=Domibacillus indicus TaxID=1437523 RepID=UPI000617FA51|nr:hypothetical protein [Domibacillus indicus]